uniref:Uncharacterized protein n=1 Tax=Anguilla anguilla TaxID=7936 RepID=A0A0E9X768_ANGAN
MEQNGLACVQKTDMTVCVFDLFQDSPCFDICVIGKCRSPVWKCMYNTRVKGVTISSTSSSPIASRSSCSLSILTVFFECYNCADLKTEVTSNLVCSLHFHSYHCPVKI